MNYPQSTLLLRHAILLQLAASAPVPLPESTLQDGLHLAGHRINQSELRTQLDYLAEKHHINRLPTELSAGLRRYQLSAAGRDYLERESLI